MARLFGSATVRVLVLTAALGLGAQAAPVRVGPVEDVSQQWAGFWNAKNLDATMTLYAPEPVFLPASGERWAGPAQLRRNFARVLKKFDPRLSLQSLKSETSGNLGYDSGTFDEVLAPAKGGKAIHAKGNYLFVFQRPNRRGGWKILEQAWTQSGSSKL
jgi:ketosteroid isomerase-like protein